MISGILEPIRLLLQTLVDLAHISLAIAIVVVLMICGVGWWYYHRRWW